MTSLNLSGPADSADGALATLKASIDSLAGKTVNIRLRTVNDLASAIAFVAELGRGGKVRDDLKQAAAKFGRPDLIPADWAQRSI